MENPSSTTRFDRVGREGWVTSLFNRLRPKRSVSGKTCETETKKRGKGSSKSWRCEEVETKVENEGGKS